MSTDTVNQPLERFDYFFQIASDIVVEVTEDFDWNKFQLLMNVHREKYLNGNLSFRKFQLSDKNLEHLISLDLDLIDFINFDNAYSHRVDEISLKCNILKISKQFIQDAHPFLIRNKLQLLELSNCYIYETIGNQVQCTKLKTTPSCQLYGDIDQLIDLTVVQCIDLQSVYRERFFSVDAIKKMKQLKTLKINVHTFHSREQIREFLQSLNNLPVKLDLLHVYSVRIDLDLEDIIQSTPFRKAKKIQIKARYFDIQSNLLQQKFIPSTLYQQALAWNIQSTLLKENSYNIVSNYQQNLFQELQDAHDQNLHSHSIIQSISWDRIKRNQIGTDIDAFVYGVKVVVYNSEEKNTLVLRTAEGTIV